MSFFFDRINKKNLVLIGVSCILFLIVAITAFLVFSYQSLQRITVRTVAPSSSPQATPKPYIDAFNQLEPYTVALMGYGGGGHEGGKLTDSILFIRILPEKKKIFLISIPRDIWVNLPVVKNEPSHWKINSAYAIGSDDRTYSKKPVEFTGEAGGGEMAKYAISTVTGLPVDSFAALDFAGFKKTIDILGGIDVKVEKTFDDPLYPIEEKKTESCGYSETDIAAISATMSATQIEKEQIFSCRYEQLHFDAGQNHMNGETALKYVRSRHSLQDGGDFNRAARQRNVVLAVKKKVLSLGFFKKIIPFINTLSYNLQTDLPIEKMEEFLRYKDELSSYEITGISLSDKNILKQTKSTNGQDILIPQAGEDQWESVKNWLNEQMQ